MELSQLLQVGAALGTLTFLAVIVFGNYRRGDSAAAKEALDLREKQIQALRDQISENKADAKEKEDKMTILINDLTRQVGELTGLITSKDHEIKRLTEILANRNPEMEMFFKQVSAAIILSDEYFKKTAPLVESTNVLLVQTFPELLSVMKKLDQHITVHKD